MFEVNNHLVLTPSYAHARYRGLWNGVPAYDFDRCYTLISADSRFGSGLLRTAAMTSSSAGIVWRKGAGALALGVMTSAWAGSVSPLGFIGTGELTHSAMTAAGSGTHGSGSGIFCEDHELPTVLHATVAGYNCSPGDIVLTYEAAGAYGEGWYSEEINCGGDSLSLFFQAQAGEEWSALEVCNETGNSTLSFAAVTCDPLDWGPHPFTSGLDCGSVDRTITVTE